MLRRVSTGTGNSIKLYGSEPNSTETFWAVKTINDILAIKNSEQLTFVHLTRNQSTTVNCLKNHFRWVWKASEQLWIPAQARLAIFAKEPIAKNSLYNILRTEYQLE
jgi:hypothetical protein